MAEPDEALADLYALLAAFDVERVRGSLARSVGTENLAAKLGLVSHVWPSFTFLDPVLTPIPSLDRDQRPVSEADVDLALRAFHHCLVVDPTSHGMSTSIRIPREVHEIARSAVEAAWASSLTELVVDGLRQRLVALAAGVLDEEALNDVRAALEAHYAEHPEAQPSLAMIVQSAAEIEGHPAAEHPDLISDAIADLGESAYVEDVLAWVRGAIARDQMARARDEDFGLGA